MFLTSLLLGCAAGPPPPSCVTLLRLESAAGVEIPTLPMTIEGVQRRMVFDTGWPGLAFFKSKRPELPIDDRPAKQRGVWGTMYTMVPLRPIRYSIAGRSAVHRWPERLPVDMPVFSDQGIDGIAGIGAIAYAGSALTHSAGGRVCISGHPCTSAPKLWTSVTVGGTALDAWIDSGKPWTEIFDARGTSNTVQIPGLLKPFEARISVDTAIGSSSFSVDGRPVRVVIGWDVLGANDWRWDVCGGTVRFSTSPTGGGS